ncbi:MAG: hypothetical protein QOC93_1087 [Actinomycetota bacterium]|nr:hypothetical protein [Actinomycetota bacterium]
MIGVGARDGRSRSAAHPARSGRGPHLSDLALDRAECQSRFSTLPPRVQDPGGVGAVVRRPAGDVQAADVRPRTVRSAVPPVRPPTRRGAAGPTAHAGPADPRTRPAATVATAGPTATARPQRSATVRSRECRERASRSRRSNAAHVGTGRTTRGEGGPATAAERSRDHRPGDGVPGRWSGPATRSRRGEPVAPRSPRHAAENRSRHGHPVTPRRTDRATEAPPRRGRPAARRARHPTGTGPALHRDRYRAPPAHGYGERVHRQGDRHRRHAGPGGPNIAATPGSAARAGPADRPPPSGSGG